LNIINLRAHRFYSILLNFVAFSVKMGGACSTYGEREVHTEFWWGDLREGDHLGDLGVDGRIMLKCIFKKWDGGMDWIELAQDRDRWRAVVNAVMNFRVS
jgi:hypothetical protein